MVQYFSDFSNPRSRSRRNIVAALSLVSNCEKPIQSAIREADNTKYEKGKVSELFFQVENFHLILVSNSTI